MKKLITVRHGDYSGEHLTERGRQNIDKLGQRLKILLAGQTVLILSSSATRAVESAEILSTLLEAPCEVHDALYFEEPEKSGTYPETDKLVGINESDYEIIILVAHVGLTSSYPAQYAKEKLQLELKPIELSKGEGYMLDLDTKMVAFLP